MGYGGQRRGESGGGFAPGTPGLSSYAGGGSGSSAPSSSSSGGGGGSGISCSYNKKFDWNCSEWTECIEGIVCDANNLSNCIGDEHGTQTRFCNKYNNCHNYYGKPNETRNCAIPTNDAIILEPIIGGCGTVTPGMEGECCQKNGFDRWNKENLECENRPNNYLLNSIILILVVLAIIFLTKKNMKRKVKKENNEEPLLD